jgi:hypothetical protein
MTFVQKDVELWSPADFVRYIVEKLTEKGINYQVKTPIDFIAIGRLMKNFRLSDRTKYALKKEIDNVFETKTFTYVNSLSFLWSLIKQVPKTPKEKRQKSEVILFSDVLKKKLRALKEEINAV